MLSLAGSLLIGGGLPWSDTLKMRLESLAKEEATPPL